jgi:cell division protein FtsL
MMKLLRTLAKSIPGIVIILVVIEILWSNTLVLSGKQVSAVDLEIVSLRNQNEQLAQQVASASSLSTIAVKAKDMGFVDPTSKQFVMIGNNALPVALNRPQ